MCFSRRLCSWHSNSWGSSEKPWWAWRNHPLPTHHQLVWAAASKKAQGPLSKKYSAGDLAPPTSFLWHLEVQHLLSTAVTYTFIISTNIRYSFYKKVLRGFVAKAKLAIYLKYQLLTLETQSSQMESAVLCSPVHYCLLLSWLWSYQFVTVECLKVALLSLTHPPLISPLL